MKIQLICRCMVVAVVLLLQLILLAEDLKIGELRNLLTVEVILLWHGYHLFEIALNR